MGGGGIKDGRIGRGRRRFRRRVAEGLEFLIHVLDAETDDTGIPVWVAGLQGGEVIAGLPVFLDGGVFLPEPGQVIGLCDERVGLDE